MTFKFVRVVSFLLASTLALAETYDTEQNSQFKKLPEKIEKVLRSSKGNAEFFKDSECKIVGVAIGLIEPQRKDAYVVAPQNGCGWGSAGGSIWVVQDSNPVPNIVLDGFGVSITLNDKLKNGFRTISTLEGNAGSCSNRFYEYKGKEYIKVKSKNC